MLENRQSCRGLLTNILTGKFFLSRERYSQDADQPNALTIHAEEQLRNDPDFARKVLTDIEKRGKHGIMSKYSFYSLKIRHTRGTSEESVWSERLKDENERIRQVVDAKMREYGHEVEEE